MSSDWAVITADRVEQIRPRPNIAQKVLRACRGKQENNLFTHFPLDERGFGGARGFMSNLPDQTCWKSRALQTPFELSGK
jgi:hypothetical protein